MVVVLFGPNGICGMDRLYNNNPSFAKGSVAYAVVSPLLCSILGLTTPFEAEEVKTQ